MKQFILLLAAIMLLVVACSNKPYPPGTMVEIVCQEHCNEYVTGSWVEIYKEPGLSETIGTASAGLRVRVLDSMLYDGVLYYQIQLGIGNGWVTAAHVKK